MTTYDLRFYGRMLGSPIPSTFTASQAEAWVGAALKNPEKRAAAQARMGMLIDSLPTEEDAARTPTEDLRDYRIIGPNVASWVKSHEGQCPCESGLPFADCHGVA